MEESVKYRIAIVDDDLSFPLVLREYTPPDLEIKYYTRGRDFLDDINRFRPNLLVLDVDMPGMSGFDVCHQVRSMKGFSSMNILFLTAQSDQQNRWRGKMAQGTDYVTKPIEPENLIQLLKRHCAKKAEK